MANNAKEEPKTAPKPDRWYNLTLGPSFKDDSSSKFCTLRYEFKPASIDKTKPGSLRKTKENRCSVEFHNNQLGKPKVTFEGSSEEYKENDAVLFFDGETFRLERLHRAVKQLRHRRQPGESASSASAAAAAVTGSVPVEPRLSPPPAKAPKTVNIGRNTFPALPVEVERIDIGGSENPGSRSAKRVANYPSNPPITSAASPEPPKNDNEEGDDNQDMDIVDIFGTDSPDDGKAAEDKANAGFDMNVPHQNDSDEEIADVYVSGDEVDEGLNAAEALRAQVNAEMNAEEKNEQTSSSSSSSGSGSSGSGSGSSSSSDSEGSDDSVNSI